MHTLLDLRSTRRQKAEDGKAGKGSDKHGRNGEDKIIHVPLGTVARDQQTGEYIGEVLEPGERLLIAEGGRGGRGNASYASSTHQAPREFEEGGPAEQRHLLLELKLVADVGLVGFPNAGKSTLISALSAAHPKVAGYPFTTLAPNLGVVYVNDFQSFVMADIPGIIEGAHEGKGLGLRFLRHIERNAILLFVISMLSDDPAQEYETLLHELEAHDPALLDKPRMVTLTMTDLLTAEERDQLDPREMGFEEGLTVIPVSAVAKHGLTRLKRTLWKGVDRIRQERPDTVRSSYASQSS
jgi:GTP-binding protein